MQLDCRRSEVLVGSSPHLLLVISSHILCDSVWKAIMHHFRLPWQLSWERIHLQCRRPQFYFWAGNIPLEKGLATHSSVLGLPGWLRQ